MGNLTFVPNANFNGTAGFTWNGSDGTAYAANPSNVIFTINSVNDIPEVVNPIPNVNFYSNSPSNFTFSESAFRDVDLGDSLTYSATLADGSPLPEWLTFNGRNFSGTAPIASAGQLEIEVQATDGNNASASDNFILNVINSAPSFIFLSNNTIAENSDDNTVIGTLSSADANTNDTHSYTLVNDAGGRFALNGNQLIVADGGLLDYETATQHIIRVRTTDSSGLSYEQNIAIALSNVNDAFAGTLSFTSATYSVNEDGTPVAIVTVQRTGGSEGFVRANVILSNGTATYPTDYNTISIPVNFANEQTSQTVTIPIVNDAIAESSETINLTLANPQGGATLGTQTTAILTIIDNDQPKPGTLAFSQSSFAVNEDGTAVTAVTLSRTGGSDGNVSVTVNLSNGSATAPNDYSNTPITVNFANGETSKTITIPITNDTLVEGNETVNLSLANPTGGATLGSQQNATLVIIDNDVQLAFANSTFSVNEDGTPINQVTVVRSGVTSTAVSATIELSDGTATSPADYTNTPITVDFAAGETSKTVAIPIINDSVVEATETVNLTLNNPTGGANLGTQNTAILNIIDNDAVPGVIQFSNATYSINENGTPVTAVTLTRNNGSDGNVSARVNLSNGTATAGSDYNNSPITVNFANGETSKTVTIPIANDTKFEPDETINLTLTNPQGGATLGTQTTAQLTIINDDAPQPGTVSFNTANYTVNENGTANINLIRSAGSDGEISVTLTPTDGTATAVSDYNNSPITVTFANGETSKTVTIPLTDDSIYEPTETVNLTLNNPTGGANLGTQSTAILNIIDNDAVPGVIQFSNATYSINENGTPVTAVTLTRTNGSDGNVSARVNLTNGTATAGSDYNNSSITVNFADGETSKTVTIPIIDDSQFEPDETINLTLSNPSNGATIGTQNSAIVNIIDNDFKPTLTVNITAEQATEGNTIQGTVTRNTDTTEPLTVTLVNSDNTQITAPTTVTIPVGANSVNFSITAVDDNLIELPKNYSIIASAQGFVSGSDSIAVIDNDAVILTLTVDTTNINENGGKAIATVTRNIITDIPLVVQLASNDTTEATVPATVTIAGNQASATFEIQGVDDTILDGTQAVIITAKPVYTNINVALQTGNAVANLNVVDNESPSLKLTIDRDVISETGTATATITRNTNTDNELIVSLNSSDTTEATVPNTVTITAGQTSATFAITGVSDGINDGSQTVNITASATGLNSGTDSLEVTDINVPDLTVTNLQGIQPTYTGKQSQFTYTVANNGIINASGSWKDRVYLSVDNKLDANDTLLGEFALGSAENPANFAPGTSYERNVTYFAPRTPGQYYLIASADSGNTVNEGVGVGENNNTTITPLTVTPAYRAIVSTDTETALTGNSVVLRGQAISNVDNSPVAFEFVKVRVENKGTIREFDSFTDANGKFVRQFTPLPGEGGTYQVNAYFPGNAAEDTAPEDEFTVLGMRFEQNDQSLQQVSRTIVEGTTVNGSVKLQNLSNIDLSGLTANVNGAPSNWTVEVTPEKANLAGDEEITVNYSINVPDDLWQYYNFSVDLATTVLGYLAC
ncbi:MAG: beta strand repeat-containing protein [Gloeotrichia echinulata HAB0833]